LATKIEAAKLPRFRLLQGGFLNESSKGVKFVPRNGGEKKTSKTELQPKIFDAFGRV